MKIESRTVANWGNYPLAEAEIATPENRDEARHYLLSRERLIARGNGKCYGDAALGPQLLSTLSLRRVLAFDAQTGIVECEAGTLFSDLLKIIVPAGWFFHVTPGIKHITVGGAVACDVHGKNHFDKGCFSNWLISFELMTADGEILTCSRTKHPDLFWQTCGGMGWTGVLLSAKFQLMKIASAQMRQVTLRAKNLENLFRAFEENRHWPYAVAWLDGTAQGKALGRGAAFFAAHLNDGKTRGATLVFEEKKKRNVSFFAPPWLLNALTVKAWNEVYFWKNTPGEKAIGLDECFYPLDSLQNWNRLYGRRGFVQYQFCLPEKTSFEGIRQVLEVIRRSSETPFLTVLKRHGERPPEALHSFPIAGWSLALDFPRSKTIFRLVEKLDDLVWELGGKIYLAKDACSAARMGRLDPQTFGEAKFHSLLKERLLRSERI